MRNELGMFLDSAIKKGLLALAIGGIDHDQLNMDLEKKNVPELHELSSVGRFQRHQSHNANSIVSIHYPVLVDKTIF